MTGALRALAVAGLLVFSSGAQAQLAPARPARARLVLPACVHGPFTRDAFVEILGIELAADGVKQLDVATVTEASSGDDESLATITLELPSCEPDAQAVRVTIDDGATSKTVQRTLTLGEIPEGARARAIALAVAELLRASWAELATTPPPPPAPPIPEAVSGAAPLPPRPAPPAAVPSARDHGSAALLGATFETRFFPGLGSRLLGARARVSAPSPRGFPLRVRAEAGALFGSTHTVLGDIDLTMASGAVAIAAAVETGRARVEIGPRLEIGWVSADGRPISGSVHGAGRQALLTTISLASDVTLRLAPAWWSFVDADVGSTVTGLEAKANQSAAGGFGGLTVGIGLGIAHAL